QPGDGRNPQSQASPYPTDREYTDPQQKPEHRRREPPRRLVEAMRERRAPRAVRQVAGELIHAPVKRGVPLGSSGMYEDEMVLRRRGPDGVDAVVGRRDAPFVRRRDGFALRRLGKPGYHRSRAAAR